MKTLIGLISLLLANSCADVHKVMYPGGKDAASRSLAMSCDSTEDKEGIQKALNEKLFIQLQDSLKDCDLTDKYWLHNYLSRAQGRPEELVETATFFTKRGASPKELDTPDESEEFQKREIDISSLSLDGPLQTSISLGNLSLTQYYLEQMSAEDVAKASFGLRGTPVNARSTNILSKYFDKRLAIFQTVKAAIRKNDEYCKSKKEDNCRAAKHLNLELADMHTWIVENSSKNACDDQMKMRDEEELRDGQAKLGKTGSAAPNTYDLHATNVIALRREISAYKEIYMAETGKALNLSGCN